jgi:hypothetical protein
MEVWSQWRTALITVLRTIKIFGFTTFAGNHSGSLISAALLKLESKRRAILTRNNDLGQRFGPPDPRLQQTRNQANDETSGDFGIRLKLLIIETVC